MSPAQSSAQSTGQSPTTRAAATSLADAAAGPVARRDAGQTSVEFMGLLVALVAVVVAIAGLGLSVTISGTIQTAICRIAGIDCSAQQAATHEPTTACETLNNTGEIGADVVAFSVDVGGTGRYILSRTVDPQGKEHWYVTLQGEGRIGADFMLGEKAKLGDLGEGVSAEIKALVKGSAATKYEFKTEQDARDFITSAEYEVGKQAAMPGWTDPFGLGHKVLDKVFGHEFKPPPPVEYSYEGGSQVNASVDAAAGVGSGGLSANGAAVVGLKVTPQPDGSEHRTVYLKLSADAAGRLGLFETAEGEAGGAGEVVVGVEYNGDGTAVTATLDATGTLKAQFSGKIPLGGKTKLANVFGMSPTGTPELSDKLGGGVTDKAQFRIDLTKGNNRDTLADGLHSLGIPVLNTSGSATAPDPVTGLRGVYDLFDDGADGTQLTVTRYSTETGGDKLSVKGGDVLTFGLEGGYAYENRAIDSGAYYSPGNGFVTWQQCGK